MKWCVLVVVLLVWMPGAALAEEKPFEVKIYDGQWDNHDRLPGWPSPFLSHFYIFPHQDLDNVRITFQFWADTFADKDSLRADRCAVTVSPERLRRFHLVPIYGDQDVALWVPHIQEGERVYFTIGWHIIPLLGAVTMKVESAQGLRGDRWETSFYQKPPQLKPPVTFQALRLKEVCSEFTVETVQ